MSTYLLYEGKTVGKNEDFSDIIIQIKRLKPLSNCGKGRLANLYWWLISKEIYICEIKNKQTNELMHYTYVMKKSYKFPFMKENDYMIGPSVTPEQFRRQGLFYRAVVFSENEITANNKDANFIGLVREENMPSRKGLEKCGLVNTGRKFTKDKIKVYREVIESELI